MKRNLLKKVVTLGLSFCIPMSGAFAFGNNKPARMNYSHNFLNTIEYRLKDDGVCYLVGGLNREQLNESDFSYESLGETKITTLHNGTIKVFNSRCSIKIAFAIAALHVLGYSEIDILDFIVDLGKNLSSGKVAEPLIDEVLRNVEHEKSDIAMNMALRVR